MTTGLRDVNDGSTHSHSERDPPPPRWGTSPYWARAFSLLRLHDHTQKHHARLDASGRVISLTRRPLPDNTQHSQETNIHPHGGIRIPNPSKRAATDPRLRPRGQVTGIGQPDGFDTPSLSTITNKLNFSILPESCLNSRRSVRKQIQALNWTHCWWQVDGVCCLLTTTDHLPSPHLLTWQLTD